MVNHANFVIPCSNQAAVDTAVRAARDMIQRTRQRLQPVVSVPEDPRGPLQPSMRNALVAVFKVTPGALGMRQVHEIKENFGLLAQAVAVAQGLCVSAAHPMCGQSGTLGHAAFVELLPNRHPVFYICPAFFRCRPAEQARTVVHELAHARLGVGHRGGRIVAFDRCPDLPLRSFDEAIDNAYAYDAFADCVGSRP